MGAVADAALSSGGEVISVMPQALVDKEVAHENLTELHVVSSMHEHKALIEDVAEAFIALPGGFGTIEELSDVLTWAELGMQKKPVSLLNIKGFYNSLLSGAVKRRVEPSVKLGYLGAFAARELAKEIG